ncbi:hypothetical protein NMG60_11025931 [Bertholletia excelsa]
MLSAVPAMKSGFPATPSLDNFFGVPFLASEGCFSQWDFPEPLFSFQQEESAAAPQILSNCLLTEPNLMSEKLHEPELSDSASENSSQNPVVLNSGSDDPDPDRNNLSPHSHQNQTAVLISDERKRRRMLSNRESARRSRMRKQKHLENLRMQVNRLRVGNRELTNRLRVVLQQGHLMVNDNQLLQAETAMLREKLRTAQELLVRKLQAQRQLFPPVAPAWPCNVPPSAFDGQYPPP